MSMTDIHTLAVGEVPEDITAYSGSDGDEDEQMKRIYKLGIAVSEDEHTLSLVRSIIKEKIWPETKFTNMNIVNDIEPMDDNTFLDIVLKGINQSCYGAVKRVLFWNRYGKEVVHVLSVNKCNAAESMKKVVVNGKCLQKD